MVYDTVIAVSVDPGGALSPARLQSSNPSPISGPKARDPVEPAGPERHRVAQAFRGVAVASRGATVRGATRKAMRAKSR